MLGECGVNPHRGHFMKNSVKKAPVEPKEETQPVLNYKKDLEEIKTLLKEISGQLSKLDLRGGF